MSFRLLLPLQLHEEMIQQARAELPNECCGLLAGTIDTTGPMPLGRVERRYPLINEEKSPRTFLSDPKALFAAFKDMRAMEWEVLAVYHSHPTTMPIPSKTDLERNFYPDAMCVIISLAEDKAQVRAWWLGEKDFREAEWELI